MRSETMPYTLPIKWKSLLIAHFTLCSLGLIKLIKLLIDSAYTTYFSDFAIGKIGIAALNSHGCKLNRYLEYGLGLIALSLFLWISTILMQKMTRESVLFKSRGRILIFFLLNSYFTLRLCSSADNFSHWSGLWIAFTFVFPLSFLTWRVAPLAKLGKGLMWLILGGVLAQFWLMFQPLIFKPMLIENDFMSMPGQTHLASGAWVDNLQFVNQHDIGGILKYDPRVDQGETPFPRAGTYVKLTQPTLINEFLNSNFNNAKNRFIYYPNLKILSINAAMSEEERHLLSEIAAPADKEKINQLYLLSLSKANFYDSRVYTPDEWDFIQKNKIELLDQARAGWFFYHHNYFMNTLLAVAKGVDFRDTMSIYGGWMITQFFVKALNVLGGVNYQNYFKLLFAIYPLYYLFFIGLIYIFFRRIEYVLLAALLGIAAFFNLGTQLIQLAVGFNPIRHFLDLFVLLSFYFYARQKNTAWLLLSISMAYLALFFNKEFGIFLLFALSGAVLFRLLFNKTHWLAGSIVSVASLGGFYLYGWGMPSKSSGFAYFLLGINSPPTSATLIMILLILNAFFYSLAIKWRQIQDPIYDAWLCALFYCQFLLIYLIWYPMPHHIYGMAIPYIILALMTIYLGVRYFNQEAREKNLLSGLLIGVLAGIYLPSAMFYYRDFNAYQKNFAVHKLYQWNFPTAQFSATMDPQLFSQAVTIIQKYAKNPGIFIISKYDDLLPTLANKYNAMPYPELLTNLITSNDIHSVIQFVQQQKPAYIFVDSDIMRNFMSEVYYPADAISKKFRLNDYSMGRASLMERLKLVYLGIQHDYALVEKSALITVYKRI